jgi:hypothetical protein
MEDNGKHRGQAQTTLPQPITLSNYQKTTGNQPLEINPRPDGVFCYDAAAALVLCGPSWRADCKFPKILR